MLRFTGVAQPTKTVTLADLGNVILNWNGDDKVNVDAELLSKVNNVYGGAIESVSNVGGAFAFSIMIPTAAWFDPKNIYDISDKDKAYIKLDYPAMLSSLIASGSVSIYAKPRKGIQSYFHKILSRAVVSGGAGVITDTINASNIIELYLKNPSSLVNQIQITKDNKVYVDGDAGSELAHSNWIHQLEASDTTLAIEFAESKDIREAISNTLSYKYTFTGAGNLAQYYSAIEFSALKQAESLANAKNM
jgi:hypothetical protein